MIEGQGERQTLDPTAWWTRDGINPEEEKGLYNICMRQKGVM